MTLPERGSLFLRPVGRGLSGEHIKLCAEGARCNAESLRQTDREANRGNCRQYAVLNVDCYFLFCIL